MFEAFFGHYIPLDFIQFFSCGHFRYLFAIILQIRNQLLFLRFFLFVPKETLFSGSQKAGLWTLFIQNLPNFLISSQIWPCALHPLSLQLLSNFFQSNYFLCNIPSIYISLFEFIFYDTFVLLEGVLGKTIGLLAFED